MYLIWWINFVLVIWKRITTYFRFFYIYSWLKTTALSFRAIWLACLLFIVTILTDFWPDLLFAASIFNVIIKSHTFVENDNPGALDCPSSFLTLGMNPSVDCFFSSAPLNFLDQTIFKSNDQLFTFICIIQDEEPFYVFWYLKTHFQQQLDKSIW